MVKEIKNKISEAGLITLDVSGVVPVGRRAELDLARWLDNELIIKESSFKKKLDEFNWLELQDSFVAISCSRDVIIPPWSYLFVQLKLRNIAKQVFFCDVQSMNLLLFQRALNELNIGLYKDRRVFLKVCSGENLPLAYLSMCVDVLAPHVKSLFYGEPCSGVPLIKN